MSNGKLRPEMRVQASAYSNRRVIHGCCIVKSRTVRSSIYYLVQGIAKVLNAL